MGIFIDVVFAKYNMSTESVLVVCDVYIKWKGEEPPRYRCYVNDELFTERTWIWHDQYLEEWIPIEAPAGHYQVRYELLDTERAKLKVHNLRIESGPAVIDPNGLVHVYVPEHKL